MHIHSAKVNLSGPFSSYRSTGDSYAHEHPNSRMADHSRTVHDFPPERNRCCWDPKAIPTIANSACSWREIVLALFDTVLRDAEDMMLSLPYDDIRRRLAVLQDFWIKCPRWRWKHLQADIDQDQGRCPRRRVSVQQMRATKEPPRLMCPQPIAWRAMLYLSIIMS